MPHVMHVTFMFMRKNILCTKIGNHAESAVRQNQGAMPSSYRDVLPTFKRFPTTDYNAATLVCSLEKYFASRTVLDNVYN